ncbi:MAG: hypothetical protein K2G30_07195 [Muribaculaceae bacterium]|nr:hypothetical protein [Muribaculaceae bacterium]
MKKILLSAAAVALAAAANAENPKLHDVYPPAGDVTGELSPKNFIGATATDIPNFTVTPGQDWQIAPFWIADKFITGTEEYGDGQVTVAGPAINSGAQTAEDFKQGFTLTDFGGDCGKVLVLNGQTSTLGEKLAALGVTGTVGEMAPLGGMPVMFWVPNPATFEPLLQGKDVRAFRLTIEYNLYHNEPSAMEAWQNAYINDDENNTPGWTNVDTGVAGNMQNFWYTWADKSDADSDPFDQEDTSAWYDEENGEDATATPHWNPNRWMVTEFDFPLTSADPDKGRWTYAPRLKWEFKPDFFNTGGAVLIRGIYFSLVGDKTPLEAGKRHESWNWYTLGSEAGVENVATEGADAPAEYFNLQGVRVANPENGLFICRQGNKVTKVVK